MQISRHFLNFDSDIIPGKVLVIFGPRQAGKTTLVKDFLKRTNFKFKLDSGDNSRTRNLLMSQDFEVLKNYIESYELLVIDEAQRIPEIGQILKIFVDEHPNLRIIVTGSSSFELAGQVGEPLTGRKRTMTLFPVSILELSSHFNKFELKEKLEEFLIYGMYPAVISNPIVSEKKRILDEIVSSYLFKDILELDKIKNSRALEDLLQLLAYQIGSEVSHSELATQLKIDAKTVGRYLDLLEKSFVIKPLKGFSRNLRKEITKKNKYYFMDIGVRNSMIRNLNPLQYRNDIGQLFENFFFIERLKTRSYKEIYANNYFWRTWDKKEIDFLEERDGELFGFECKWNPDKKMKAPKEWVENYPDSEFQIINRSNFIDWLLPA
jgi:uncharacterized protein